jgi:hypothetical protein
LNINQNQPLPRATATATATTAYQNDRRYTPHPTVLLPPRHCHSPRSHSHCHAPPLTSVRKVSERHHTPATATRHSHCHAPQPLPHIEPHIKMTAVTRRIQRCHCHPATATPHAATATATHRLDLGPEGQLANRPVLVVVPQNHFVGGVPGIGEI